jgi:hypothetical protein
MSMYCKYRVWEEISEEKEKKINELGLQIDLHPHRTEKQKEVEKELRKTAESMGETLPKYNSVHITRYDCLNLMGAATDVEIGHAGSRTVEWMPIPATPENRCIVRNIEEILFQKE